MVRNARHNVARGSLVGFFLQIRALRLLNFFGFCQLRVKTWRQRQVISFHLNGVCWGQNSFRTWVWEVLLPTPLTSWLTFNAAHLKVGGGCNARLPRLPPASCREASIVPDTVFVLLKTWCTKRQNFHTKGRLIYTYIYSYLIFGCSVVQQLEIKQVAACNYLPHP